MRRDLQFRRLSAAAVLRSVAIGVVSIVLAVNGAGAGRSSGARSRAPWSTSRRPGSSCRSGPTRGCGGHDLGRAHGARLRPARRRRDAAGEADLRHRLPHRGTGAGRRGARLLHDGLPDPRAADHQRLLRGLLGDVPAVLPGAQRPGPAAARLPEQRPDPGGVRGLRGAGRSRPSPRCWCRSSWAATGARPSPPSCPWPSTPPCAPWAPAATTSTRPWRPGLSVRISLLRLVVLVPAALLRHPLGVRGCRVGPGARRRGLRRPHAGRRPARARAALAPAGPGAGPASPAGLATGRAALVVLFVPGPDAVVLALAVLAGAAAARGRCGSAHPALGPELLDLVRNETALNRPPRGARTRASGSGTRQSRSVITRHPRGRHGGPRNCPGRRHRYSNHAPARRQLAEDEQEYRSCLRRSSRVRVAHRPRRFSDSDVDLGGRLADRRRAGTSSRQGVSSVRRRRVPLLHAAAATGPRRCARAASGRRSARGGPGPAAPLRVRAGDGGVPLLRGRRQNGLVGRGPRRATGRRRRAAPAMRGRRRDRRGLADSRQTPAASTSSTTTADCRRPPAAGPKRRPSLKGRRIGVPQTPASIGAPVADSR